MSLPNVAGAVALWEVTVKLKTITPTVVNGVHNDGVVVATQRMVVQPQNPAKLKIENIDISQEYLRFHSRTAVAVGQVVEFSGKDYRLIMCSNWGPYGYWEAVGVETRRALLVANP